jgi:hypothetical protein
MNGIDKLKGSFGFNPDEGPHHFLVTIPDKDVMGVSVIVYDCPRFLEKGGRIPPVGATEKVQFPTLVWKELARPVKGIFNLRLKEGKRKVGSWKDGGNYLAPHFGKELVLLGWALEDNASNKVDTVFRNWRGLAPEERWWLYSTANAPFSQNSAKGRGIGWRKALVIALSENPIVDQPRESSEAIISKVHENKKNIGDPTTEETCTSAPDDNIETDPQSSIKVASATSAIKSTPDRPLKKTSPRKSIKSKKKKLRDDTSEQLSLFES